ncbi:MAG: DNA-processing protein DprA [Micrococcales bacterium]
MNAFKISNMQLEKLMQGVSPDGCNLYDAFARAVWSLVTEPGDSFATALISTLGAKSALESELNRITSKQYVNLIKEAGFDDASGDRFKNFDSLLSDARERWQSRLKLVAVENMLAVAKHCKATLVTPDDSLWPEQLSDLNLGTPHCLWLRGARSNLVFANHSMAVVGARQATSYGDWVTTEIVSAAADENISIISGGAYGIDAVAHRSALATNTPTIAIMAGGIDRLYPSGNIELLSRVVQTGLVISEQAPGSNPTKWRFLQRNRLIAALSSATIVVEAGKRSGAINTAHHAIELHRALGVVPGPISSPASLGCHNLIKENHDYLLTSAMDAVNLVTGKWQPELFDERPIGPLETRALDAMGKTQVAEPEIATRAGLTTRELIAALGRLQLLGLVAQGDRGWRKLT